MGWSFGQKLRYLRTGSQLTQAELAQRLQLASHAHVSNLETRRFTPSLDVILAVADVFAVRVEYLIREELPLQAAAEPVYQRTVSEAVEASAFGPNLSRLRGQAGLTQAQLAEQLGLASHAHVSFLESGQKQPSVDLVLRVADRFAVTVDQLLSASA
ncbi:helix-turn-helix domain-containing protein [Oscillochloris sp. ZM17-4]|uniref:helix-turn-helix domain-containing protein n=1 Tax=Oscillochloris sp. ZM17-4 TaxID=2866714 RepID=UPI001C72D765|nr:helix-turn-helix transcriptional regulator [Oscillochloris sp. ZM17-4]MBX0326680.1 helix-turn-helix domain-containing protein [Oscillochloris sp. ZM17-4]